ncbi:C-type lectin-like [Trinorchestia longiramus]|nr:C-type lectin-like [Trinorchestia longiramus]
MSPRPLAQLLLQLLVWTGSCSWGLDDFYFYRDLKLADNDVAQTRNAPSTCACFAMCRTLLNCTAATFTPSSSSISSPNPTGSSCFISSKGIFKYNLQPISGGKSTTLIVGYQLYLSNTAVSVADAKDGCKNLDMQLASLSDEASFNYVRNFLKGFYASGDSTKFLIGLAKIGDAWIWPDGVTETSEQGRGPWGNDKPGSAGNYAVFTREADARLVDSNGPGLVQPTAYPPFPSRATKIIPEIVNLRYERHLQWLELISLEQRLQKTQFCGITGCY